MARSSLIQQRLKKHSDPQKAIIHRNFFKNCKTDIFLGIPAPIIRIIAKEFWDIPLKEVRTLMHSKVRDERSLAHAILRLKFEDGNEKEQGKIYQFYLKNRKAIRDWDGVDDSAPYIVGKYLLRRDKKILYTLVKSNHIWDRRIAIVSTWWFIRKNKLQDTLKLAGLLLKDEEDLIHKATGWMLREVGKRDIKALKTFLKTHHPVMPRTTLRYAIERFAEKERKKYLRSVKKPKHRIA